MKIFYFLFLIIIAGCNSGEDEIPEPRLISKFYDENHQYFNNNVHPTLFESSKFINQDSVYNLIIEDSVNFIQLSRINYIEFSPYLTLQVNEIIKDNIVDYLCYKYLSFNGNFNANLTQIEYPLDSFGRKKMLIFGISYNRDFENLKCTYIEWSNIPYLDNSFMNDSMDYSLYLWGINKSTDTITTNLSIKTIKKLYPDFKGKYIFKKYRKIIIDHSYSSFDNSLFNNIKFVE
ncbi:MAG TPA: hypothetical protein PLE30_10940 [Candidatus Kapabacteria bacterium]|nr:hypothetical protein [Candidatus Kapabacteria bacterium]